MITYTNAGIVNFEMQDSDHICTFKDNRAHTRHHKIDFADIVGRDKKGYGRGGGVFLAFEQEMQNTTVITATFSNSRYIGNTAFIGSGLSVKIGEVHKQNIELLMSLINF